MKYLIVSDIHGAEDSANKVKELFETKKFDKILCLGDLLYHGPRNDLPANYNPKKVISIFNELKDFVLMVQGNCEAYVDSMVLDFPYFESAALDYNGFMIYLTHGHFINPQKPLNVTSGAVLYGHTHIYKSEKVSDVLYLNPGSMTLPKENTKRSYGTIVDNKFSVFDLEDNLIFETKLK